MPLPRRWLVTTWVLAGVALVYGLYVAVDRWWVCDDAFISYRYCQNLVDGLGLVYNAGERVEGYTNFLWCMLLSGGMVLGADPIPLSQVLGILCYLGTILVLAGAARRAGTIPVAAIGLALHEHSAIFATGGLETALYTLLVTAGLVQLIEAERPAQFGRAGLWLILATMTRPDGALFYALSSGVVLTIAVQRRAWWVLGAFAAPFVGLYLPYFAWKLSYYGYPFPNTYYAKSAGSSYAEQGWHYVGLYFSCYYYLLLPLVAPLAVLVTRLARSHSAPAGSTVREPLLIILFTLPFLAYVVRVGGDFMFSRFCLPVTPALLLGVQLLAGRRLQVGAALVAVVVFGSLAKRYPEESLKPGNPRYVSEERIHYPEWYVTAHRKLGHRLREIFAGGDLRLVIGGAQAMLGYFSEAPYVLEIHGLTDTYIAHREVTRRGRPGHEKALPLDDPYLREKGVDLILGQLDFPAVPSDPPIMVELRRFQFTAKDIPVFGKSYTGDAPATLITWDPALLEPLKGRPDVKFTHFPSWLDGYIEGLGARDPAEIRTHLRAFDAFYFDHAGDSARRQRILDHLAGR